MKKTERIGNIICIASIILIGWVVVSYADVIAHQSCGGTNAGWNLFNIILNIF